MKTTRNRNHIAIALIGALALMNPRSFATDLSGSVQSAAKPIAGTAVTLYAAGTGAPTQLAQAKTDDQGVFKLT